MIKLKKWFVLLLICTCVLMCMTGCGAPQSGKNKTESIHTTTEEEVDETEEAGDAFSVSPDQSIIEENNQDAENSEMEPTQEDSQFEENLADSIFASDMGETVVDSAPVEGSNDFSVEDSSEEQAMEEPDSMAETEETNNDYHAAVTVPTEAETDGNLVWVPVHGGTKYHSSSTCSNMIDPIQVSIETAEANGYTPCARCH